MQRATRKHTMVGQKYFKAGKRVFGGWQTYTKYYKINNNSEVFRPLPWLQAWNNVTQTMQKLRIIKIKITPVDPKYILRPVF